MHGPTSIFRANLTPDSLEERERRRQDSLDRFEFHRNRRALEAAEAEAERAELRQLHALELGFTKKRRGYGGGFLPLPMPPRPARQPTDVLGRDSRDDSGAVILHYQLLSFIGSPYIKTSGVRWIDSAAPV